MACPSAEVVPSVFAAAILAKVQAVYRDDLEGFRGAKNGKQYRVTKQEPGKRSASPCVASPPELRIFVHGLHQLWATGPRSSLSAIKSYLATSISNLLDEIFLAVDLKDVHFTVGFQWACDAEGCRFFLSSGHDTVQ
ncbi:hypothetical protein CFAM422_001381 [Trichoderma lentiforme]|uniref:Uncharacterized protein n=1 Tax=Trichoderma lentiforme TaxID=1567552 RepID=A0A9P4XP37_9HYPO|nr:hypothetical protein CFAM422_001381 [Trichoderma lentiforme]